MTRSELLKFCEKTIADVTELRDRIQKEIPSPRPSLGQIAYEAWASRSAIPLPWEYVSMDVKMRWESIALAVKQAERGRGGDPA